MNLLLIAREDWTERQRAMVRAYEEAGTQNAVADRFGVSQQVVSATLDVQTGPGSRGSKRS